MIRPRSFHLGAGALAALVLFTSAAPLAATDAPDPWRFSLRLGGLFSDAKDDESSKFQEYRDLSDGLLVDDALLHFDRLESPWSFDLSGENLGRRDERANLSWRHADRFRLDASWVRTPHFLSNNAVSLWGGPRGDLQLADGLQGAIESFFTGSPAPNTASARSFMNGVVAQQGRDLDLRVQRDTAKAKAAFDLTDNWSLALYGKNERKSGTSRIGTGTYIRRQTVNSFDRNRFEPRTNELPLPVDYKTEDYGLGTGWRNSTWFFDASWQQSSFTNSTGTLRWDNPFEGPPGATSSLTGLNPAFEQEPSGATANTNNRGRFSQAELDLFPDNDYERLNFKGGLNLPARTRINASYSTARMEQDDAFLAYTINPAVIFANGPDGVGGTADDILAKDVALPANSLGGEIETTRLDLRVTSRPIDPLSLRAAYRSYEYDDQSPSILFPGFAAAGDSYFRPGIGQRTAAGTRVLYNEPGGYTRSAWNAGAAWRFGEPASIDVEYTSTEWEYDERQVESTSEDQLAAKLRFAFGETFEARLTYLDASREADGPYAVGFETSRLRAFDVWDRDRTRYGAELSWILGERSSIGLTYQNWQDEYPGVLPEPTPPSSSNPFPSQPYGLNESTNESYSLTFSTGAERWNLAASVGVEATEWTSQAVAKTSLTGDSPQFDPSNAWRRTQDDDVLWASLAFDSEIGSRGKLEILVDYHDYEGDYLTTNLGTPTVNDGVALPVPGFSSNLISGEATFTWALSEHVGLGARYLYEPYELDDWQWDLVEPYMQGVWKEIGGTPSTVRDATAYRSLLLDATYSDYSVNVLSLFFSFRY